MDNNQKPQQQQLQLNLRPEIARGEYSNLALITHSHTDFILDFARHLPGMQQPEVCSRVIMAPEHAKRSATAHHCSVWNRSRRRLMHRVGIEPLYEECECDT